MGKSKESRLKAGNVSAYLLAIFFLASAGFFFYSLSLDWNMVHVGLLGLLSLVTAFGVFRGKNWGVWIAFLVFCGGNAFALSLLLNPATLEFLGILAEIGLIIYLILIWAVMIYLASKRKELY